MIIERTRTAHCLSGLQYIDACVPQVSRRRRYSMTNPATASDFCSSLRRGQERNHRYDGNADAAIAREDIHLGFSVSALFCFDCYFYRFFLYATCLRLLTVSGSRTPPRCEKHGPGSEPLTQSYTTIIRRSGA